MAYTIEEDKFDPIAHEQALSALTDRLHVVGIFLNDTVTEVRLDPFNIIGMENLVHIKSSAKEKTIVRNHLTVVIDINHSSLHLTLTDNNKETLLVGEPTRKGYRSKLPYLQSIVIDQGFNLTTRTILELIPFVHNYIFWKGDWFAKD